MKYLIIHLSGVSDPIIINEKELLNGSPEGYVEAYRSLHGGAMTIYHKYESGMPNPEKVMETEVELCLNTNQVSSIEVQTSHIKTRENLK